MPTELSEHKRRVADLYNLAAAGYDRPALRFFPLCAHRLVELAGLQSGQRILDVATGAGAAAIRAAQVVGSGGQVVGVDIANDMLDQARCNVASAGLTNVELREGDAEQLDFPADSFDAVLCAAAVFFLPDLLASLREWLRVCKPGGWVAVSGFGDAAFQPISDLYEARIRDYGATLPAPRRPFSWQQLADPEAYRRLLRDAGADRPKVRSEQLGYYLGNADDWWDIVWSSGFRGPASKLAPRELIRFKAEHLTEVGALATDNGIWLDVPAIFALGRKPGD